MANGLISIIGIDNAISEILRKCGINTLKDFYDATRSPKDREALSKRTGLLLANISEWAVQAELLRVDGMNAKDAMKLIKAGVYSVEQLQTFGENNIMSRMRKSVSEDGFSRELLKEIRMRKIRPAAPFVTTGLYQILNPLEETFEEESVSEMYEDFSVILTELGKGIAQAQHQLDMYAIEMQKKILEDENLASLGITATGYVMPEAEFNLKLDYSVVKERSASASNSDVERKLKMMPINATAQNYFRSEKSQESTLRVRFVPVPIAEKFTKRVLMPDCVGKSGTEALDLLIENEWDSYKFLDGNSNVVSEDELDNYVVSCQSVDAGRVLTIGQAVVLKVKKN